MVEMALCQVDLKMAGRSRRRESGGNIRTLLLTVWGASLDALLRVYFYTRRGW